MLTVARGMHVDDVGLCYRVAPSGQQKTLADFGHPRRRICDLLLALNVVMFGLQWASGSRMLMWGAKVSLCTNSPPDTHSDILARNLLLNTSSRKCLCL